MERPKVHIPDAIGKLHCLEKLNLKGNNFVTLPSLKDLFRLYNLNIQHCKRLKYFPDLPSRTDLPSKPYNLPHLHILLDPDEVNIGIMSYNCGELVDRERKTATNAALWLYKATHQYGCLALNVGSIIPGSKIPRDRDMPNIGGLKFTIKIRDLDTFRDSSLKLEKMEDEVFLVEVKKYGYRWVSEQDLELSNSTRIHGGNVVTLKR
ncbi:unnamed protein product [Sphenostylis stenocarpa]|uniref:Uncharacterized protein n=1 Tax=Sphenostylis stenocarpa TaxID=92480 RepID=A0AA86W6B7_9FABA|nr:unnamed protein product [Sphenostylis stenocarpa]